MVGITHDPFYIRLDEGKTEFQVDLGAETLLAAEKAKRKIAVEIKTFRRASLLNEFHAVIGQFINYRLALSEYDAERILYLTLPASVFQTLFRYPFVSRSIAHQEVKLITYDIDKEMIATWLE